MSFESSNPVRSGAFFNRGEELKRLLDAVDSLRKGAVKWFLLLGQRKIGKTSLLYEFEGRLPQDVFSSHIDCWEMKLNPETFFLEYISSLADNYLLKTKLAKKMGFLRSALALGEADVMLGKIAMLDDPFLEKVGLLVQKIKREEYDHFTVEAILGLPQFLAVQTDRNVVVIIDEFQELTELKRFKMIRETVGEIFPIFRSVWQSHDRVNYIVAGSKMTLLKEMTTSYDAPFILHFDIVDLNPFSKADARELLHTNAQAEKKLIPNEVFDKKILLSGMKMVNTYCPIRASDYG